jgi:hypothetical protein
MNNEQLVAVWDILPLRQRVEVLGTAIGESVLEGMGQDLPDPFSVNAGGGLPEQLIQQQVMKIIEPMLPVLGEKLLEIAEPAAQKAAEVVGPVVKEQLDAQIPKLAVITGIVAGLLVVGGIMIGRKIRAR